MSVRGYGNIEVRTVDKESKICEARGIDGSWEGGVLSFTGCREKYIFEDVEREVEEPIELIGPFIGKLMHFPTFEDNWLYGFNGPTRNPISDALGVNIWNSLEDAEIYFKEVAMKYEVKSPPGEYWIIDLDTGQCVSKIQGGKKIG